jgi:hypothetical protein
VSLPRGIRRVRVHEFFRDYDKLRSGLISKAKFRNGLEACKFFALNEVGVCVAYSGDVRCS